MQLLHRRDWLKKSSMAGLGFMVPQIALAAGSNQYRTANTLIRLTSNENPYGPSPMARKAMAEAITSSNRYPWDLTTQLREKLGEQYGLTKDHVLMGAGSSEILGLVAQLAALEKGNAITADPSFSIWVTSAQKMGLEIIKVPLSHDKKLELDKMLSKLDSNTRLFYICNPNNPTGTVLPFEKIKQVAEDASKKSLVLIDEAYIEYAGQPSQVSLVNHNKNIIIAKTFSKIHGLAGGRIGYALAHPDTIRQLGTLQPWINAGTSAVSLAAALASMQDKTFISNSKEWNKAAGDLTQKELTALGLTVIPSSTNFIYYSLEKYNGNWQENLRAKNVLSGRIVEPIGQWTRTTIGTMEEMKQFIAAARSIV